MARTKVKEEEEVTGKALAVLSEQEKTYLAARMEERPRGTNEYIGPPRLSINEVSTDAEGNKRPIGGWHIKGTDMYFDGPVYFRPVRYARKLIRYNSDFTGIVGQSIYFNDYREELLDTLGGLALGRKFGRAYSQEEKDVTKKLAEIYMDVFGFVRFGEGTESHEVVYRVRGTKAMQLSDAFEATTKTTPYFRFEYKLETFQDIDIKTKQRNKYWSLKVTPDMSTTLPITPIMEYDAEIKQLMAEDNKRVVEQHKANRTGRDESRLASEASARVVNATATVASKDLNDDLPF